MTPAAWGVPTTSERGDRIRGGPQVGMVATSPLPPEGSPPLQSGGTGSEFAHKWARWLHHPCRLGGPHRFRAGSRIRGGPQVGKVATSPLARGGSPPLQSGGAESEVAHKWASWLHHPCRLGGPHRFRAGEQNQRWPTSGQGGYMTPAAWGVPTASERGDRIRSGPPVGKVATSPLPPGGSPPFQSGGTESELAHQWARWLHHPCRLGGSPPLQSGGTESKVAHKWARWLHHPCRLGGSPRLQSGGTESEVAHQWARWLHHPCRLGGPHRSKAGGQNQNWPTSGQDGYITPAAWGSPPLQSGGTESQVAYRWARWLHHPCRLGGSPPLQSGGTESEVAHQWARWLHHPCRLGGPHRSKAGGQNQKWPTSGQGGYITPAAWGSPPLQSGGTESQVAHKWARWLHHPCRLGGSPPLQSGGTESKVAHKWARWLHHPCRLGVPHRFKAGGQNQNWPTSGHGGYITPAAWGSPPLQSGRTESELAHKWARWLHHRCRLGVLRQSHARTSDCRRVLRIT